MDVNEVRVCCLAGTGGTGKTTVVENLLEAYPRKFRFKPSIVRAFYKKAGIKREEDFFNGLSKYEQSDFQVSLMKYYMCTLNEEIQDVVSIAPEHRPHLLLDRSIYDHVAYWFVYCMTSLSEADIATVQVEIDTFKMWPTRIVYFPFPVGWDYANGADGFRFRSWGKDFVHDSVLRRLLRDNYLSRGTEPLKLFTLTNNSDVPFRSNLVYKHATGNW